MEEAHVLIDVTMPIRSGEVFRLGTPPVEIATRTFHHESVGEFETTILSLPAHTATHIDLVFAERRIAPDGQSSEARGLDKLKVPRSEVPAVTHVDFSARVQTVDARRHGRYHKLIERFRQRTGCPVIINTSFNVRGEPIVCTPQDAYHCFMATNMDVLVMENTLLLKEEQPAGKAEELESYLSRFELD